MELSPCRMYNLKQSSDGVGKHSISVIQLHSLAESFEFHSHQTNSPIQLSTHEGEKIHHHHWLHLDVTQTAECNVESMWQTPRFNIDWILNSSWAHCACNADFPITFPIVVGEKCSLHTFSLSSVLVDAGNVHSFTSTPLHVSIVYGAR